MPISPVCVCVCVCVVCAPPVQAAPSPNAGRRGAQKFISRCHVADIVAAVLADAARRGAAPTELMWPPDGVRQHNGAQESGSRSGGSSAAGAQTQVPGHEAQQLQSCQELLRSEPPAAAAAASLGFPAADALVDIINVVDDQPLSRAEVEAYVAHILSPGDEPDNEVVVDNGSTGAAEASGQRNGRTLQERSALESGSTARQRPQPPLEEKRVRNNKFKKLLRGGHLYAPTVFVGIDSLAAGDVYPFTADDLQLLLEKRGGSSVAGNDS
jgi:hypothetical protein